MKLREPMSINTEKQLDSMYFVGRLAKKTDLSGTFLSEPVSFQDDYNEYIQFQIKCLSEIPADITDTFAYTNKIFTGSTRSNFNSRELDSALNSKSAILPVDKKQAVADYLSNRLILFKMVTKNQFYIYIDIIKTVEVKKFESEYTLIPSPQLKSNETQRDFEYKISKKLLPFTLPCYPNMFKEPEYIYYEGRLYSNLTLKQTQNIFTYNQEFEEEVEFREEDTSHFLDNVVLNYSDLLYVVSMNYAFELRDEKKKSVAAMLEHEAKEQVAQELQQQQLTVEPEKVEKIIKEEEENIKQDEDKQAERLFLERLKENAKAQGLIYTDEDIYNFHTCVKTNLLTIIGGMSGIGKSRLAILYAKTLGLNYGKELIILPISPAYTEPNDILGYLNPNTGIYNESETGIVKLLMEAEADANRKDDGKMYMVVFDEMNLAQVEHWFSPFISLLEMPKAERYLTLYNENSHCLNNYKSKIKISDNVMFVGTVNFDETTKLFSDRLLDRANIFVPEKPTLQDLYGMLDRGNEEDIEPVHCTRATYHKWTIDENNFVDSLKLYPEEINILDKLHQLLNEQDRQKGVSFRTTKSIAKYLNNIPVKEDKSPYMDRKYAFDMQIKQRIITKIRGIDSFVRPLVGTFTNDDVYQNGKIAEYLTSEEVSNYYHFDETMEILNQKAKELMYYGFAY